MGEEELTVDSLFLLVPQSAVSAMLSCEFSAGCEDFDPSSQTDGNESKPT